MFAIAATIKPGEDGLKVVNLQAVLLLLLERGVFKSFDPPDHPSADDLKALAEKLRGEQFAQLFGEATRQLLMYFQVQQGLGDHLRGVVEETTAKTLNQLLGQHGVVFELEDFVVKGRVTDTRGRPRSGLKVVAFDRDLRRHQRLNDAPTNAEGFYEIRYRLEDFRRADGQNPLSADLFVVVLPDDGLEPLATSDVRFHAKPVETIDLVVAALQKEPSEFERIGELVLPLLKGQGAPHEVRHVVADPEPTDLLPHEVHGGDVEFIVRETGLDAAAVQDWATAARLWRDAQALLPQDASAADRSAMQAHGWPFFFGWRRAGLTPGLAGALRAEPEQWAASLRVAQSRNWSPSLSEPEAKALQEALERLGAIASLDPVYAGDPLFAAIGAKPTGLPPGVAVKALNLYRAKGLDGLADFGELAGADGALGLGLAIMAKTLRVYDLADGNAGLIQPLMQRLDGAGEGLEPLASLGSGDWLKMVQESGFDEAGGRDKAAILQLKVEQMHPTPALQARVANGDVVFEGHDPRALGSILQSHTKAVDNLLRGGDLDEADAFVAENPALAEQIRDHGRWVKAGAGFAVGSELINLGFRSPGWLTNYGETVIDIIAPTLPQPIRDIIVGAQGRFRRDIRTLLGEGMDPFRPPVGPQPGPSPTPQFDPLTTPTVPGITAPTVRGMFGDLDDCVCMPCESVLGQGAYLVDLLNLLKREVLVRGTTGASLQTGIDLLRARRPDILDLDLNCENAEVLLPHVDLALEALEWRVASARLGHGQFQGRTVGVPFTLASDANVLAMLQSTCSAPLGVLQSVVDARNPRLWRVTDGLRTWLIEALPLNISLGQVGAFLLLSLAIRRTEASPDPRIEPAHRNPSAYSILGAAIFPWSLPFDLAVAESRQYQARLQLPRLQLLERFAAVTSTAYANEVLGLTTVERGLLAEPRTGDALWQAWGFANAALVPVFVDPESSEQLASQTPQQLLQRASILLARSKLGLADLEGVLATRFVGGFVLTERHQCKTSLMRVAPNMTPEALDRLHRFVRLWQKLPGWTISFLDSTLTALNPLPTPTVYAINADLLAGIAALKEAHSLLGLPNEVLLGLRVPLWSVSISSGNGRDPVSLFASAFLSSRVGSAARDLFASVAARDTVSSARIVDNVEALAAALGANASAIALMVPMIPEALGNVISHNTLTWLSRHFTLARALGVSVVELRLLVELTGFEPLGAAIPPTTATSAELAAGFASLLAFAKAHAKVHESGLPIALLAGVLLPESHTMQAAILRPVELKPIEQITSDLKALRKLLREAEAPAETDIEALAQQVRGALSRFMDSEIARRVVAVFGEPQSAAEPVLLAALSGSSIANRDPFGIGLFTQTEATELLTTPLTQRSREARLTQVLASVGAQMRRSVLAETLGSWTGLTGATLNNIIQNGLMVDPAATGGAWRSALTVLTHRDFWTGADATSVDSTIVTWAKRLNRLMAVLKGMDLALALKVLAGRDWATSILPSTTSTGVTRWQTLAPILDLRWLAQSVQLSEATLHDHLDALAMPAAASNLTTATEPLARRLRLEPSEVLAIASQATVVETTVAALRDPVVLRRVTELAALARPLRATAGQLAILAGSDVAQMARTARQLLVTRVGAESWPATLTSISDILRKQQRDALVAYLLQTTPGLADANGLYEQLLIDPQIQPCFMTTRITQAVASVQLLIQRMLFGLEPDALISENLRERWTWMRSYRMWEANRKVFLYPENWLFPELRDDKSTSFRQLEAALSQGELSHERAGQAFGQFLDDMNQVAQTQIIGLFEDVDTGASGQRGRRDVVMVGRSPNPPYFYYWRRCQDFGKRWMEWSPWERIELDIQGDHVMPFVINGRFHVAWPVIHEEQREGSQVINKWRLELAWSQFDGTTWQQVRSSRDNVPLLDKVAFENVRSGLAFRAYVPASGSYPTIYAYVKNALTNATLKVEEAPDSLPEDIIAPPRLLALSGVAELASLLFGRHEEFKLTSADHFDVMQLYCAVWKRPNPPVGYRDLSKERIFFNSDVLTYHRWERNGLAKSHVDSVTFSEQDIKDFITDYRRLSGYGNSALYTFGSWTQQAHPFYALVHAIMKICSLRKLTFRAWVKLGSSSDSLELKPGDGTFTLRLSDPSQTITLKPGELLPAPIIKAGVMPGGAGDTVTLTWNPPSYPSGTPPPFHVSLNLVSVDKGKSVHQTLHFEIDDTRDNSGFLSRTQTGRDFRQVQKFTLQPSGAMVTQAGNGSTLEIMDGPSDTWMNGFQEKGELPQAFPLTLRTPSSSISVFNESRAGDRYWVVGAGVTGASSLSQTNLWYFQERNSACLIDVWPELEPVDLTEPGTNGYGASISVYPTAWHMGAQLSQIWHETGHLPSGNLQTDDFGAAALPALSSSVQGALPRSVVQGAWLFDNRLPNACYNWEVYFHAPLLIADHLSKQHRFEDAERWLRMVFDPNNVEPGVPQLFLAFRVFREMPRGQSVTKDLKRLAKSMGSVTTSSVESTKALIAQWRKLPYRPFVIARRRHVAFLWRTLFAYLDNLLAWADNLYRRDTREAIGEAAQLYILAARILGPKPRMSRARRAQAASSYTDLALKWDEFANAWFDATTPAVSQPPRPSINGVPAENRTPAPEGFLFFCIPINDKLNTYWDLVNERLFNIRHCRNLEGIERDLSLTDPPIDPELLVRATAAGLDINDVVRDLFARPLSYRYSVLVARALDLAGDVRAFGGALLSAIEKRDAEHLAQLRSTNEIDLLKRVTEVRKLQIEEAERNLEALRTSRAGTAARYEQLQRQLGKSDQRAPIEQETTGEESQLGRLADGSTVPTSNWGLIVEEQRQMEEQATAGFWTDADSVARIVGGAFSLSASITHLISPTASAGQSLSALASAGGATADAFRAISQIHQTEASHQATSASHIRRRDEWSYQSNQVLRELKQIDKQILANEIRIALTKVEMQNHETQIEQAQAIADYLHEKFTNTELYKWMESQLSNLHGTAYRMAIDMARKAERAATRELGIPTLKIIRSDYWNSRRASLLAGEHLHLDLKRLEITYLDQNRREYELTKHISLRRLNPEALVKLRTKDSNGRCRCEFDIPEWLFDLDTPGHYLRRIKSVSVSIPSVTGPYTSVSCKLTLLKSGVRHERSLKESNRYLRLDNADDDRFTDYFGASEAIVTSTGNGDSGLFETNLRDERFLPFEGSGVISRWRLELPGEYPQFDYSTISDVVLSIRYTARDGGDLLRVAAKDSIAALLTTIPPLPATTPLRFPVVLSCRSDFPTEWARAKAVVSGGSQSPLVIPITYNLLPYWMDAASLTVHQVRHTRLTENQGSPVSFTDVTGVALPISRGGNVNVLANLGGVGTTVTDVIVLLWVGNT